MKSRSEFIKKAQDLTSSDDCTAVDHEAASILTELAGSDEQDFVTEDGALDMLSEWEHNESPTVVEAIKRVEQFIFER